MINVESIRQVLATIPDPEMPISILDLGLVEDVRLAAGGRVEIDVLPTFVGCPALPMIEEEIREKVGALAGVLEVEVRFLHEPPWTVDRISVEGRRSLAAHGVAVPEAEAPAGRVELRTSAVACPFCRSTSTQLESPFGPTRCRMIYYCDGCGNSFERMKRLQ